MMHSLLLIALSQSFILSTLVFGFKHLDVPTCNFHTIHTYPVEDQKMCVFAADQVYFHGIFDFQKSSAMALFVNQVCRALAVCIPPANFRLIFHTLLSPPQLLHQASHFLTSNGIHNVTIWDKPFDSVSASKMRLVSLADVHKKDQLILQVDADEFANFDFLSFGIKKLLSRSNRCDYLMGTLRERVAENGHLINITLSDSRTPGVKATDLSIEAQFPWTCELKKEIEAAADRKLVLYRALYRPAIGNHRLMCQRPPGGKFSECMRSFKNSSFLPPLSLEESTRRPAFCHWHLKHQKRMLIDHYKYTYGIIGYLRRRVQVFKEKKLEWWRESWAMLKYLHDHGNRVCVECQGKNDPKCQLVESFNRSRHNFIR